MNGPTASNWASRRGDAQNLDSQRLSLSLLNARSRRREVPAASDFQLGDELKISYVGWKSSDISLVQANEESANNDDDYKQNEWRSKNLYKEISGSRLLPNSDRRY